MVQTFDECLREWIQDSNMTIARLAAALDYKSKTTISRVLNRQSTFNACLKVYDDMSTARLLDEKWNARFSEALKVEQNGKSEYETIQAIQSILSGKTVRPQRVEMGQTRLTELLIAGCPWMEIRHLIRTAIAGNPDIHILHFLTDQELSENPSMLLLLISSLSYRQYEAVQIQADQCSHGMTWNFAIGKDSETGEVHLLTASGSALHWSRVIQETALFDEYREKLMSMNGSLLFRNDRLSKGIDYIEFLKQCFQMEHEHCTAILRPVMGIQMLPISIVVKAFDDFIDQTKDPIKVSRTSLIYHLRKRVDNFNNQSAPIHLILSRESIAQFVKNGLLPDQFYAIRPFTQEERKEIIDHMIQLAYKENIFLHLIRWKKEIPFACEAYENEGAIVYPSRTNYISNDGGYRELFLPGKKAYALFERFIKGLEDSEQCLDRQETLKTLTRYSRMLS